MSTLDRQEQLLPTSVTERAQTMYLEGIKQIPGVLRVAIYGGSIAAEQTVLVIIPALRGDVADQVIDLEGEVRRAYPGSRLEVQVKSLKERGLNLEEAPSLVPVGARIVL